MDYIEVTAKTVQDAILEASLRLETFRDNIEYEVIEEGSSGFLGFGGKKAVIRARRKVSLEDVLKEEVKDTESSKKAEKKEFKKEVKKEQKEEVRKESVKEPEKEIVPKAAAEQPVPEAAEAETEEKEERKERKVAVLTPEEQKEAMEKAEKFLKDVFASIDMEVEITTDYTDEMLNVELAGEDMGVLIGKHGQTLDSLQYLTSLIVN